MHPFRPKLAPPQGIDRYPHMLFMFIFKSEINLRMYTCLVSLAIVMEILLDIALNLGIKIWPKTHDFPTI